MSSDIEKEFDYLDVDLIVPSLTNPRTNFPEDYIDELATDFKRRGVDTPITVRPLPASRLAETSNTTGRRPTHEIVFGECRWRGCKRGELPKIPARIRKMTDEQVLEAQLVENLKRKDLTDLEEAEGYQRLIEKTGIRKEDIGEKIGKSRSYVYARLKLLDLGATGREAMRTGKIDFSVALLIARIPNAVLQNKALKEVLKGSTEWIGGQEIQQALTYQEAAALIQHDYMLQLKDARFNIKDATLIEGVPGCKTCPKRTGANPDMFEDVKGADVCTDPQCFHQKEQAHDARQVDEAKAAGKSIIVGKAATELHGHTHMANAGFTGHKRLDDAADSPVSGTPLRKLIGAQMKAEGIQEVLIEGRKKGQMIACLPNDVANRLIQIAQNQAMAKGDGEKSKTTDQALIDLADRREDERTKKAQEKAEGRYEQAWRDQLVKRTWEEMNNIDEHFFTDDVHRFLLLRELHGLSTDDHTALCTLLGLGQVGASASVREQAIKTDRPDLMHLLVIMQRDAGKDDRYYDYTAEKSIENAGLMLVAKAVHGEAAMKSLIKQEQAEAKALHLAPKKSVTKSQKPPAPNSPAAQANGVRGEEKKSSGRKGKISAEEAQRGIATAMQGSEASASAPGGAVAPTSLAKLDPVQAWPFPIRAGASEKTNPGSAKALQSREAAAPAAATGQQVDQAAVQDPLFDKALAFIKKAKSASVRPLKAKLGVSSERAMKILAELETAGHVGPMKTNAPREVLV